MKKINSKMAEFIREAVAAGKSYESIGRSLGISGHAVGMHVRGLTKVHRCKICGALIGKGEYCTSPECRKAGDAERKRRRKVDRTEYLRKWRAAHPHKKYPRKRRGAARHQQIELMCATCGRSFLRSIQDHQYRHNINSYCTAECFYNRKKVETFIEQKIANITILAGLVDKEKTLPGKNNLAYEMSQPPESENHMK
ncbi:MAG: hypothetical protein PHU23_03255 [Dehalococcoidales bacterium]|nr:hypothetical protein [Dehalococcoidales bacterium]